MYKINLVTFFLCCTICVVAQKPADSILNRQWDANWITPKDVSRNDYGVFHFRKSFRLEKRPSTFIVHVSADNRYKLYVNGKLVSLGPARGDLYHWNFETVDLAPLLKEGNNTLSATVWYFASRAPEAQISFQPGFILQGNSATEAVCNTNATWKATADKGYSPLTPDLIYAYYVAGPGDRVENSLSPKGWMNDNFDETGWQNAVAGYNGLPKNVFSWTDGWMLVPSPLPQMELKSQHFSAVRKSVNIRSNDGFVENRSPLEIPANTKASLILDQGFLTNAYPHLHFQGGKNAKLTLTYAEALYIPEKDSSKWKEQTTKGNRNEIEGKRMVGVKDQCISDGSQSQLFVPLAWRTFRYVQLDIETSAEAIRIDSLFNVFTGYPFRYNASFKSGNKLHDRILETGWRTARLCAVETYMDCPYYEQLQYVGDTRIQALVSLYNSGDDRLMRNAIEQLDKSRMAEGITLSRYPTRNAQQIPTFSFWWIGMIHDYWMYRNDAAFVRSMLPGIRQVLSFFEEIQQQDGRLKNPPYWVFTDWTSEKGWNSGMAPVGKDGCSAAVDLQLLWALQLAAKLESGLGLKGMSEHYNNKAETLKKSIRSVYWDASKNMFADSRDKETYSQHVNTLAILTGITTAAETRTIADKLMNEASLSQATIYFLYYVNQALCKAGYGNLYLDRLNIWEENLKYGMTTWAEISDINNARSDCHAWGSSPNIEFFRIVLGIDSDAPGFNRIRISPRPGKLSSLSGKMPHPKGTIEVNYGIGDNGAMNAEIKLPEGTSGTFVWNGKEHPLKSGNNSLKQIR